MVSFIDAHRAEYGVESICAQLPIAPSTYYESKAREANPERLPPRVQRDIELSDEIQRVWDENFRVYGAEKVWKHLKREQIAVAHCTVERLMRVLGLQSVVRGRACRTTLRNDTAERPADLVQRQYTATRLNQLWVADFTFVTTWAGFVYVAFVVDVFARRIVGWRVASSMRTDLVLDALEQALWSRSGTEGLVHHSDRGSQPVQTIADPITREPLAQTTPVCASAIYGIPGWTTFLSAPGPARNGPEANYSIGKNRPRNSCTRRSEPGPHHQHPDRIPHSHRLIC